MAISILQNRYDLYKAARTKEDSHSSEHKGANEKSKSRDYASKITIALFYRYVVPSGASSRKVSPILLEFT